MIWQRVPKEVYVGRDTLELGLYDAIAYFNIGSQTVIKLLEGVHIEAGRYTKEGCTAIDRERTQGRSNGLPSVIECSFELLRLDTPRKMLFRVYQDHVSHLYELILAIKGALMQRDVRHNKLKTWQGVLSKNLPALQQLHVWGNPGFVMRKDLLRRTTAQLITGTITTRCVDCSLRRVNNISREFLLDIVLSTYRGCVYYPKEHYQQLDSTRKKMVYFNGFCKRHNCTLSLTSLTPVKMLRQDRCLRAFRKLRPLVYTLGLCAMGLNLVVFTVIVCMKYLRSSVAFLLIAHLSLCDFLIGVYAIGAAVGNGSATSMVASKFYRLNICPYFWMIFVLGQFLSALTCLLVTVERYMTIVHCMKPHLRLTRSLASILLPASWVAALALGIPLERYDTRKISGTIMCIMVRNFMPEKGVLLSQCLMILFLSVYIVVVSLYIHIYIAAKKSCTQSGRSKRESRLARRIGLITLSNFVFFAVPNIAMFTFATNYISLHGNDVIDALIRRWVPPMCLVFNACVNPCLFAFGNRKFTTGARHCAQRMRNKALALLQQQPNI
ncbi:predicted protein [Nematostella vectensis]|uniref:G-protein coupled receptors family 1 profile domain-containing protein n=1 Tax=Nematostella vectensis TaxID=45351 RepID=A7SVI7_NEMVE|nr:predicted protein [Nematostella vectensis]|eukprot:XP_001624387.1 predicted protein [Nematostella vectensis]